MTLSGLSLKWTVTPTGGKATSMLSVHRAAPITCDGSPQRPAGSRNIPLWALPEFMKPHDKRPATDKSNITVATSRSFILNKLGSMIAGLPRVMQKPRAGHALSS